MIQIHETRKNGKRAAGEAPSIRPAILTLGILQVLMLGALYTKTPPHPPLEVAPFALGPFISASIAIAFAAYSVKSEKLFRLLSLLACLTALVSYGPHKWFDPAIGGIWPAVLLAQLAVLSILIDCFKVYRKRGFSIADETEGAQK